MRRVWILVTTTILATSFVPRVHAAPRLCMGERVTITGRGDIEGTRGDDVILGSRRRDRIRAGPGDDVVCAGGGEDLVQGAAGADRVSTGRGDDDLQGGPGDDALAGGAGRDQLQGHAGDDRLDGSTGRDGVFYLGPDTGVTIDLDAGTATGDGSDALAGIENAIGTFGADRISGDDGPNALVGSGGSDVINGRGGDDYLAGWQDDDTINGGGGDDDLWAYTGADVLHGDDGRDVLTGDEGDDLLDGGPDADTLDFSAGGTGTGVEVNLTTGIATGHGLDLVTAAENVIGTINDDEITGNEGPNRLFGDWGGDTISGLGGDDWLGNTYCCGPGIFDLDGGAGDDRLIAEGGGNLTGGAGDDVLKGTMESGKLDGGPGTDVADYTDVFGFDMPHAGVYYAVEIDLAAGMARPRECFGECTHDTLTAIENVVAESDDDVLVGDAGPNVLSGAGGNDEISGGGGDDVLDGGEDFFDPGDGGDGGDGNDTCRDVERPVSCESVES